MWPDNLRDIFARIGIKNIWSKIGQQEPVFRHFLKQMNQIEQRLRRKEY